MPYFTVAVVNVFLCIIYKFNFVAQVMVSWFVSSSPMLGSALTVQSLLGILSPSLSAPPPLILSFSPSLSLSISLSLSLSQKLGRGQRSQWAVG